MEWPIARWFGVLAVAIICVAGLLVVRKHGFRREFSLSQHVGLSEQTFLNFAVAGTVANVLFFVFGVQWLKPHFGFSELFFYIFWAGMACHLISAWTPTRGADLISRIHDFFAMTMAILMPVILLVVALAPAIPLAGRVVALVAAAIEATLMVLFFVKKSIRENYFVNQFIYIVVYYIAMLLPAYLA